MSIDWPAIIPDIRIQAGSSHRRIESKEMFGCLPRIGFRAQRAIYEYPDGRLTEIARYEVMCQFRYAGMDVYEIAELPNSDEELSHLWYFGLSTKGVHCLRYVTRYRNRIGKIEEYSEIQEPAEPRMYEIGYAKAYEWSESWGDEEARWHFVDEVTGPYLVSIADCTFECLAFENMILRMDGRPMHLNMHFIHQSGRKVLYRRWEGEGNGRYPALAKCSSRDYKGFTWRQAYDMLADIAFCGP